MKSPAERKAARLECAASIIPGASWLARRAIVICLTCINQGADCLFHMWPDIVNAWYSCGMTLFVYALGQSSCGPGDTGSIDHYSALGGPMIPESLVDAQSQEDYAQY